MDFLEKIVESKKREVAQKRSIVSVGELVLRAGFDRPVLSLAKKLKDTEQGEVIAEFKRRSPSSGELLSGQSVRDVTTGYRLAGAAALSVLTDRQFFGALPDDLPEARLYNELPILRKDFIIDEYQLFEAKAMGSDIVLLIAECLHPDQAQKLAASARQLGLEVLLEMHSAEGLSRLSEGVSMVGINNRDLHSFQVDLATSFQLIEAIPGTIPCISESGISRPEEARELFRAGYRGFLMGTHFVRSADPAAACAAFIDELQALSKMDQKTEA